MIKLSIVIPVFNGEKFIEDTASRFLNLKQLPIQIILVNDASTDKTKKIIESLSEANDCIEVIHCGQNVGAGIARNRGFKKVKGQYVLFFDADDLVYPEALNRIIEFADQSGVDTVVTAYDLASDAKDATAPMHHRDLKKWKQFLGKETSKVLSAGEIGHIASSTNYPWNKLIRTEFAKRIGLKFGDTPVHNDILGSWYATALADSLAITSEKICTHIVPEDGNNITNITDERRMKVFDALDAVEEIFDEFPERKKLYYSHFLNFKILVLSWARSKVPRSYRKEFDRLASKSLRYLNLSTISRLVFEQPKKVWTIGTLVFCITLT